MTTSFLYLKPKKRVAALSAATRFLGLSLEQYGTVANELYRYFGICGGFFDNNGFSAPSAKGLAIAIN